MKAIVLAGATLAVIACALPADARTRYVRHYAHARTYYPAPRTYSQEPYTSPFFRGRSYYDERDPFIRGQVLRDLPPGKRPPF
jgi:hypothetical protein